MIAKLQLSQLFTTIYLDNGACSNVYLLLALQHCGVVRCGGLAQLGERFNRIEEINGSSPLSSTSRLKIVRIALLSTGNSIYL